MAVIFLQKRPSAVEAEVDGSPEQSIRSGGGRSAAPSSGLYIEPSELDLFGPDEDAGAGDGVGAEDGGGEASAENLVYTLVQISQTVATAGAGAPLLSIRHGEEIFGAMPVRARSSGATMCVAVPLGFAEGADVPLAPSGEPASGRVMLVSATMKPLRSTGLCHLLTWDDEYLELVGCRFFSSATDTPIQLFGQHSRNWLEAGGLLALADSLGFLGDEDWATAAEADDVEEQARPQTMPPTSPRGRPPALRPAGGRAAGAQAEADRARVAQLEGTMASFMMEMRGAV